MLPGTACPLTSLKAFFYYLFVLQIPLFSPILFLQAVAAAEYIRKEVLVMSKEEIALELTKLSYHEISIGNNSDVEYDKKKLVTAVYNYIYSNIQIEE